MLLITGASGAYGYFFIYENDELEVIELDTICLLYTSDAADE